MGQIFNRILIANRGEIACRVIDTARRLGVETVAVYSDADRGARHVEMADQAVRIGPAPVQDSYLLGEAIIAAAIATGAEAIHPGYGFLSENPEFVDAVEAAGLIFIGPSAKAIRAMGLKDAAKELMAAAGVPVVPGYHGADQGAGFLSTQADTIGYPVLIKAVAGGGGKGMRKVDMPSDFATALKSAQSEARTAFGNDTVLIEKFIRNPRHIEIQIFGDGQDAVHLFERDCSLQRRHQKVIEEAPAPGMTAEMRNAMGAAAVQAAKTIGYAGAGTVEFIVDGSGPLSPDKFWFMEMNTRLQVEHPVTEAVTGIDLVEWQLQVASGGALPLKQDQITVSGHAFEARLYAEDTSNGFLPATGTLTALQFPETARIDTGVREGDEISPFYDPMIAKLTVHGSDRAQALKKLEKALHSTVISGCTTNLGFLSRLARHEGFAAGQIDTGLIGRDVDALCKPAEPTTQTLAIATLALLGLPRADATGFTLWQPLRHPLKIVHMDRMINCFVAQPRPGEFEVVVDGTPIAVAQPTIGGLRWHVESEVVFVAVHSNQVTVIRDAETHVFARFQPGQHPQEVGGDVITAPMPGLVKSVSVVAGQIVTSGQPLLVLEAMKMEHALTAPRGGVVAEVLVEAGQQVSDGDTLLRLEDEDSDD